MSTNKYYKLSAELLTLPLTPRAMILYAILADRQELSRKTGDKYHDKDGYYIIYTITDICAVLGIGERTAKYALAELEDAGLIERRKQGRTKPQKIYVQDIVKCKKLHLSEVQKIAPHEVQKTAPHNNNTDLSNTDTSSSAAATASHLPELLRTIDECAAELKVQLDDKARLKLLRKIQKNSKKIHALKPWLLTVMSSSSMLDSIADDDDDSGKGYQPSYDIAEYESTSVLDEEWDD